MDKNARIFLSEVKTIQMTRRTEQQKIDKRRKMARSLNTNSWMPYHLLLVCVKFPMKNDSRILAFKMNLSIWIDSDLFFAPTHSDYLRRLNCEDSILNFGIIILCDSFEGGLQLTSIYVHSFHSMRFHEMIIYNPRLLKD